MSFRKHLEIYWENYDDQHFRHACELACKIGAFDEHPVNSYEHEWLTEPEWARLRVQLAAGFSQELDQLWQLVKDWPATFANWKMIPLIETLRGVEACLRRCKGRLHCLTNPGRNLRYAGCSRLYPAVGPLLLGRPFDPQTLYWGAGRGKDGVWHVYKSDLEEHWQKEVERLGLNFCPCFEGYEFELSFIPISVRYGEGRAWKMIKDDFQELAIFPSDLELPEGYEYCMDQEV